MTFIILIRSIKFITIFCYFGLIIFIMNRRQIILVITSLIVGAFNTLGFTLQNKQIVEQHNTRKPFFHPYMQAFMIFASGIPALFIYFWHQYKKKAKDAHQQERQVAQRIQNKPNKLIYIVPTLFDYTSTVSFLIALNYISGSVYLNLRGGMVITTFLLSYFFLKLAPTRSRIIGCIVVILGLLAVGITNLQFSTDQSSTKQQILIGYGLIVFALIGNSCQFVFEEYLMRKYNTSPFFIVGINAVYGVIISIIVVPLLAMTPCSFGPESCVINQSGNSVVEDPLVFFRQVGSNYFILAGVISTFITMALFTLLGVIITKQINSVARAICDVSRTVIVWIIGIIITISIGRSDKRFMFQSLNRWQLLGEAFGFIVLIIGNLIYYEVINLNHHTREHQQNLIDPPESQS